MEVYRKVTAVNGRVSYMPATAADTLISQQKADSAKEPSQRVGVYARQDIAHIDSADYYEAVTRRNGQEVVSYTTEKPKGADGKTAEKEVGETGVDPDSVPRKSRHQANAPGLPDLSADPLKTYRAQGHHVVGASDQIQGGTQFRSLEEAQAANSGLRTAAVTDNANGQQSGGTGDNGAGKPAATGKKANVGTAKSSTGKKAAAPAAPKGGTPAAPATPPADQQGNGAPAGDGPSQPEGNGTTDGDKPAE